MPASLHNDMGILKSIGIAHEAVASLNAKRQLLNQPKLEWDKEGKQFRAKKTPSPPAALTRDPVGGSPRKCCCPASSSLSGRSAEW